MILGKRDQLMGALLVKRPHPLLPSKNPSLRDEIQTPKKNSPHAQRCLLGCWASLSVSGFEFRQKRNAQRQGGLLGDAPAFSKWIEDKDCPPHNVSLGDHAPAAAIQTAWRIIPQSIERMCSNGIYLT